MTDAKQLRDEKMKHHGHQWGMIAALAEQLIQEADNG